MENTIYSFPPIADTGCKVLIVGSMPGIASLEAQQYYAHKRNAFWKIIYQLWNAVPEDDYSRKREFLLAHNIALWDMAKSCHRSGSLDSNMREIEMNDIPGLLKRCTKIKNIFANGTMAHKLARSVAHNVTLLPSTSPANTMPYDKKLESWKIIKSTVDNEQF